MSEDTVLKIRVPSSNPWMTGPIVEVLREDAVKVADIAASTAENLRSQNLQSSWAYDAPVFSSISSHMPTDPVASDALFRATEKILAERMNRSDWYEGNYAAYRCLSTRNAYATPGFTEALRNASNS